MFRIYGKSIKDSKDSLLSYPWWNDWAIVKTFGIERMLEVVGINRTLQQVFYFVIICILGKPLKKLPNFDKSHHWLRQNEFLYMFQNNLAFLWLNSLDMTTIPSPIEKMSKLNFEKKFVIFHTLCPYFGDVKIGSFFSEKPPLHGFL